MCLIHDLGSYVKVENLKEMKISMLTINTKQRKKLLATLIEQFTKFSFDLLEANVVYETTEEDAPRCKTYAYGIFFFFCMDVEALSNEVTLVLETTL